MTRDPQPALSWFRRPKRSWQALHPPERAGYIMTALGGLCLLIAVMLEEYWVQPLLADPAKFAEVLERRRVVDPIGFAGFACLIPACIVIIIGVDRALIILRQHQFLLCPGCGYDLLSTPRAPICHECGRSFGPKGVISVWARMIPRRVGKGRNARLIERHPEDAR